MAIYHFTAKIVGRKEGRSVVGAAAYRAGMRLQEESTQNIWDYTRKRGIEHTEILAPDQAPTWVFDRSRLWNAVDKVEKRKDAQLARDIEIALPVELDRNAQVELLRDFARREFVSKGMIADCAIHRDNPNNPHAHVLLTLRRIGPKGFELKERSWNSTAQLLEWRSAWAEMANEHLAKAGFTLRIDHRTLEAQGLDLIPTSKIGVSLERQKSDRLPPRIAERVAEHRAIAAENGSNIIVDPGIAIKALTHYNATFTEHDIARFLHTRTDGAEQFREAYLRITTSHELVLLGTDDRDRKRFTSREMLEVESAMLHRAELMSLRQGHRVSERRLADANLKGDLSPEQSEGLDHLIAPGDLKSLVGIAGSGKSHLLKKAREIWEAQGYTVKGAALSGIAAENLELSAGISSRTLASYELAWKGDRHPLTSKDVLVIDEAGMVGTRQLARVLEAAEEAKAKVILVGDPEQLQSIEAGAAFRGIMAESGVFELNEVRRQKLQWQRQATREFATGSTADALRAYERNGSVIQKRTREQARSALINQWSKDREINPDQSRLILAYTRDDVRKLNELARTKRRERHELGRSGMFETERGAREFAVQDRLYFLRNESSLGVKNGTLGTITGIQNGVLQVRLDNKREEIQVDTRFYRDLDHGYAATLYKAQAVTVGQSYILATAHFDRHATYVGMSRHRESAALFYAAEDFAGANAFSSGDIDRRARRHFIDVLSRARPKELAHDYLERAGQDFRYIDPSLSEEPKPSPQSTVTTPSTTRPRSYLKEIDAMQQRGAERWREKQIAREKGEHSPHPDLDQAERPPLERNSELHHPEKQHKHPPLEHPGIEDDLEL